MGSAEWEQVFLKLTTENIYHFSKSLDTLGELTYLMRNGNITDCLSQTWCYLKKYNNPATKQRFDNTVLTLCLRLLV